MCQCCACCIATESPLAVSQLKEDVLANLQTGELEKSLGTQDLGGETRQSPCE